MASTRRPGTADQPNTAPPPGRSRPTSRDVASHANVSQATVSLVLGGKWQGRVSPRTAETVRDAARTLGYRPNLAARSLRLGRTRTALLVVPALTHDYFARVYAGASQVAAEHDFGVVLYPSPEGTGPAVDPFGSARAALDGVIASSMAPEALAALGDGGLPLVMLDTDPEGDRAAARCARRRWTPGPSAYGHAPLRRRSPVRTGRPYSLSPAISTSKPR